MTAPKRQNLKKGSQLPAIVDPELVGNEGGKPREFDENKSVPPLAIVRSGLATMANEMGRLVEKSKESGLNGMQAHMLKEYIKVASDVAKKHKNLEIGYMTPEELETAPDEVLAEHLMNALEHFDLAPPRRQSKEELRAAKRRVIEHEN